VSTANGSKHPEGDGVADRQHDQSATATASLVATEYRGADPTPPVPFSPLHPNPPTCVAACPPALRPSRRGRAHGPGPAGRETWEKLLGHVRSGGQADQALELMLGDAAVRDAAGWDWVTHGYGQTAFQLVQVAAEAGAPEVAERLLERREVRQGAPCCLRMSMSYMGCGGPGGRWSRGWGLGGVYLGQRTAQGRAGQEPRVHTGALCAPVHLPHHRPLVARGSLNY
jgi:hypothetical protein